MEEIDQQMIIMMIEHKIQIMRDGNHHRENTKLWWQKSGEIKGLETALRMAKGESI